MTRYKYVCPRCSYTVRPGGVIGGAVPWLQARPIEASSSELDDNRRQRIVDRAFELILRSHCFYWEIRDACDRDRLAQQTKVTGANALFIAEQLESVFEAYHPSEHDG